MQNARHRGLRSELIDKHPGTCRVAAATLNLETAHSAQRLRHRDSVAVPRARHLHHFSGNCPLFWLRVASNRTWTGRHQRGALLAASESWTSLLWSPSHNIPPCPLATRNYGRGLGRGQLALLFPVFIIFLTLIHALFLFLLSLRSTRVRRGAHLAYAAGHRTHRTYWARRGAAMRCHAVRATAPTNMRRLIDNYIIC